MKAQSALRQLSMLGAIALAHAAGLWALFGQALQSATPGAAQRVITVSLLSEPAAAFVPAALPPPPVRPELPAPPPVPPPPIPAVTAPAMPPLPSERPLPSHETSGAPAIALPTPAPEPGPPAPVARARAAVPEALRQIEQVDYVRAPVLEYPGASRRYGEQGRVVLRVLIGRDGQAEKIELHEASAFVRLNEAAMDAVRRALFKPYTEDGVAQPAWALVALNFQLRR